MPTQPASQKLLLQSPGSEYGGWEAEWAVWAGQWAGQLCEGAPHSADLQVGLGYPSGHLRTMQSWELSGNGNSVAYRANMGQQLPLGGSGLIQVLFAVRERR